MSLQNMQNIIKRKSLSEQVFDHIKRMILSEELKGVQNVYSGEICHLFLFKPATLTHLKFSKEQSKKW